MMIEPFTIEYHDPGYRPPSKAKLAEKINEIIDVVNELVLAHPRLSGSPFNKSKDAEELVEQLNAALKNRNKRNGI